MTKRLAATLLGAFLVAFGVTSFALKAATATEPCTITNPSIAPAGTSATFTVSGDCTVTLVSYQRNGKGTLAEQTLHDATTKEFSCKTSTSHPSSTPGSLSGSSSALARGSSSAGGCSGELTVTVPECLHQVDLIIGRPRTPPDYGRLPGELLGFRLGGTGECQTPSTTTSSSTNAPTTTTSTPTTSAPLSPPTTLPNESATANQPTASTTSAAIGTPSTPTELPNTGAGLLGLTLVALGCIGTGRYVEWRGKRRAR